MALFCIRKPVTVSEELPQNVRLEVSLPNKPKAKAEKLLRWIMCARCKTRNLALDIISPVICTSTVSTLVVKFSEVIAHHQRYHFKNWYWNMAVKFGAFRCFFLVRYANDLTQLPHSMWSITFIRQLNVNREHFSEHWCRKFELLKV